MILPPPNQIGLPPKFDRWRNGQDAAVVAAIDSPKRFVVQNAPTGFGKTVCYMAQAALSGARTAVLTVRKGLQTQLLGDFSASGLVDIRGQANYPCVALRFGGELRGMGLLPGEQCDAGPCHVGARCSHRTKGCHYFDALAAAKKSPLVVSNYSYWIHQHHHGDGLGKFDLLILDEAHEAPDELAQTLEIQLSAYDVETLLGGGLPESEDPERWRAWARETRDRVALREANLTVWTVTEAGSRALMRELHMLRALDRRLSAIAGMAGDWIIETTGHHVRFSPVWAAPYAEDYLFLKIPKVVLVSATIRPKTLELLGIAASDSEFREYPSTFPIARRPVCFIPSVRCNHRWTETDQKTWVRRMDQIIDRRLDRKGIIHTVSYERRNIVLAFSEHRDIMLFNDGADTEKIVRAFRQASAPAVLVSPSMSSGWDLPLDECEYAIVAKIPFIDTRSPVLAKRAAADDAYSPYVAMLAIVQASGRGMRSEDDQCEIFILDDNWRWFWWKYRDFAPKWFQAAVPRRPPLVIPGPLPKLQRRLYG